MEDTITKFEETFGSGSHDSHMIPRRGTTVSQGSSGGSASHSLEASNVSGDKCKCICMPCYNYVHFS